MKFRYIYIVVGYKIRERERERKRNSNELFSDRKNAFNQCFMFIILRSLFEIIFFSLEFP